MWRELQQVKKFREQQAQTALLAHRSELAVARRAHEAAELALQAHRRLAQEHEYSLYAELLRKRVKLRDIEDVQHTVAHLRRTEQDLVTRQEAAAAHERRHENEAALAQQAHRAAERVKEKFDQMAGQHFDEAAREAERVEDLELEEVAALRRDRDDWDSGDEALP
ncbi:type III secretion system stalk subunit SctO [Aquabacterium sp.]|uniref:type III secretion system stalk subunit SctO n=1 Tax=Aquabacterium sp. TaxID=1872578 RepID=UPI002D08AFD5|nr:YscO family type III secretion system apparatus protein [Aquabacterium sp.]HSW06931.1 YscO family type III secretion system apparatus protein [Aquabacterium sp.]